MIKKTNNIVTVEDNSETFGIGSEILVNIVQKVPNINFCRISAEPYPIPSIRELEDQCLPTLEYIIKQLKTYKNKLSKRS